MMKKIFVVMLMAVAVALPSQAQLSWGLMGGLNVSNVSTDITAKGVSETVNSRSGFFIGPTVKFTVPVVGIGVDVSAVYDQREGKAEDATTKTQSTIKAQSIQIPINVRYTFGLGSMANVFAFVGPQFGFNVGSDQTLAETASVAKSEWTLKSSNLSFNIGVGATVFSHLQAKVNYNFALGKTGEFMNKNLTTQAETVVGSAKTNAWQVSLAYFF